MKKIMMVILLMASLNAVEDDKKLHIGATTFISFATSATLVGNYGLEPEDAYVWGIVAAMAVGLGKELYDSRSGGTGFSGEDMVANGVGAALGGLPVFVIVKF